jgi:hypothetical protein
MSFLDHTCAKRCSRKDRRGADARWRAPSALVFVLLIWFASRLLEVHPSTRSGQRGRLRWGPIERNLMAATPPAKED